MNIKYVPSNAGVVKAVEKSTENPYGIVSVEKLTPAVPSIIIFGGELTYVPRFANHYIKQIKQLMAENDVHGADIYSVFYEFGSREAEIERINLFRMAGHRLRNITRKKEVVEAKTKHMTDTEPVPSYIEKLYDILIEPILVMGSDGTTPDVVATENNAALLRMYAHSHGAAVIKMLGDVMADKMRKLKFTPAQIKKIQSKIIAIQHGPIAPLEKPRFTTLSFASASDTKMNMHNAFSEYALDNAENMYPSYFSQGGAHLFAAGQIKEGFKSEHDTPGLLKSEDKLLTDDGRVIFAAQRNAIINSIRAAINGNTDITVPELVSGNGVDFEELKSNGEWFYKMMLADIRSLPPQIPTPEYQK